VIKARIREHYGKTKPVIELLKKACPGFEPLKTVRPEDPKGPAHLVSLQIENILNEVGRSRPGELQRLLNMHGAVLSDL
jgi:hypothetical protein